MLSSQDLGPILQSLAALGQNSPALTPWGMAPLCVCHQGQLQSLYYPGEGQGLLSGVMQPVKGQGQLTCSPYPQLFRWPQVARVEGTEGTSAPAP